MHVEIKTKHSIYVSQKEDKILERKELSGKKLYERRKKENVQEKMD